MSSVLRHMIIRPANIVGAGLMFYRWLYLLSFFVGYLLSSLNGTRSKPATCSEVNTISKRMSKIWGIPSA